jgi:glycosyltransferase involved in cell wall biosynthesis
MMKSEKVTNLSAIIPIKNYFQHKVNIEEIIHDSVLMDIELILVLDQETGQAFEDLTALLKMLKAQGLVITSDSGNPGGARNAGMVCATAEWVTFWDCDDRPQISKIFEMILGSKVTDKQVLIGSYQSKSHKDEDSKNHILDESNWKIDLGLNPGIWRFVFRRDFISTIRFPDAKMGEDQVFLQRVLNKEPKVFFSQVVTYVYRTNIPNQLTGERANLIELVQINQTMKDEFIPQIKYSIVARTMIIRQLLTLFKSENLGNLTRLSYIVKAIISLTRNPLIAINLIKIILEKLLKWS